jgi:hypothetical protein
VHRPTFSPMTLPVELYDAVCERISQEFADSYLTGAVLVGRKLTPRTLTAYDKMRDVFEFRQFLAETQLELAKPLAIQNQAAPILSEHIHKVLH